MTSLELQLKRLKADASAQNLSAKRDYSSLLFDEKEAQNYTREQFYEIGLNGLSLLCKFDSQFDSYEPELFEESKLEFNRGLLKKGENNELNEILERFIVRLTPYFHHFCCKQVLEWLIHKYRIHAYNAELLATAFLPYHTTNSYGRLLKILRFQNLEWSFTEEYVKSGTPIPINVLLKVCFANNSFLLIPTLSNHLVNAIRLVGDEYATEHLQTSFTFFASFLIHLFENASKVNNQLISRAIPYVGIALKSKILPFKCAGLMITTRIVLSTQLNEEVLTNMLKLTLLKVKKTWVDAALDTAIVICQTQKTNVLPRKATLKLIHNREELDLVNLLLKRMEEFDITAFLSALWNTLFLVLNYEMEKEERKSLATVIVDILDLGKIGGENATNFLKRFLEFLNTDENRENNDEAESKIPTQLRKHIRAIIIRFSIEFDVIRAEWMIKDKSILDQLMTLCQIELHEVGELSLKKPRRRRTSSCCSRLVVQEDSSLISDVHMDEDTLLTAEEKIKNAQLQIAEHRQPYCKSVLKILTMMEEKVDPDTLEWALKAFNSPSYLKKQSSNELEEFLLKSILFVSRNPKFFSKSKLKTALTQIKIELEVMTPLLSDLVNFEPSQKRSKMVIKSTEERIANIFAGETCDQYERRIQFVLEILNIISAENFTVFIKPEMIRKFFHIIEKQQCSIMNNTGTVSTTDKDSSAYIQQLCLGLVVKILEKSKTPFADTFILDSLVKVIRFAHTSSVFPNALKVLTLIAPIIPSQTVSQFMSLFTFMGNGIIRRDNEMTLKIFEDTLCALFGSVLRTDTGKSTNDSSATFEFQRRLTEITRVFAVSLVDIPAHRRMRILRVVLSTIPREYVWIVLSVLFEHFCSSWEKMKAGMINGKKEHLDDVLLDPLLNFFDSFSL